MPDKKLTDNEIVKALKEILEIMLVMGDLQKSATIRNALDLINRLQAENEQYKDYTEKWMEKCDEIQAENERLSKGLPMSASYLFKKAELDELITRAVEVDSKYAAKIKAEAYKEFAKEIFELFPADKPYTAISRVTVKHILKELVGEDNANVH